MVGDSGVFETRVSVKQFDVDDLSQRGRRADGARAGRELRQLLQRSGSHQPPHRVAEHLLLRAARAGAPGQGRRPASPTKRSTASARADRSRSSARMARSVSRSRSPADGRLGRSKTAAAWATRRTPGLSRPRLTVQYGARYDYDSITGDVNVAPRGSFTAVASARRPHRRARRRRRVLRPDSAERRELRTAAEPHRHPVCRRRR